MSLADTRTAGRAGKDLIWIMAPPGTGKTSMLCAFRKPFIIMTGKEPGLDKLITQGRVPEVPHTPPVEEWEDFGAVLTELVEGDHDYEMIGIDSLSDVCDMAKEHVIQQEYGGDGTKYSASYGAGSRKLKVLLGKMVDQFFRLQRKTPSVGVAVTSGVQSMRLTDPMAGEYFQWAPTCEKAGAEICLKAFDMVLHCRYEPRMDRDGKAIPGTTRVMITEGDNTLIAKNRHGLPRQISMGSSGEEAVKNLGAAIVAAQKKA